MSGYFKGKPSEKSLFKGLSLLTHLFPMHLSGARERVHRKKWVNPIPSSMWLILYFILKKSTQNTTRYKSWTINTVSWYNTLVWIMIMAIDTLIFDAIIKLRNNKKQPNENSIHTLILKDCKSLSKKQL